MSENLIRQYLAIAFVLFAYYAYLSNKKTYMFFLLCCVPLIHISGIIVVAAFVILYFFKIPIKKPWILLIIYLIIYTLWDISFFSAIVDKVSSIVLGNKFQAYLDNAERWFTSEGSLSNAQSGNAFVDSRSLPNMVAEFLSLVIVIYYGFKVQVTDRKLQIAYYFAYFAIIFKTIGSDIEIYIRFRCWFDYLLPFILGVILYKAPMKSYEKYLVWAILFINYGFYGFIRQIGDIPNSGVAFIWDK